jgi:hypothetical protein
LIVTTEGDTDSATLANASESWLARLTASVAAGVTAATGAVVRGEAPARELE